jgi:hypothetical protein
MKRMSERDAMKHGDLLNIYRIVNVDHADLDLTRAQAVRLYQQLRVVLYPRSHPRRARVAGRKKAR